MPDYSELSPDYLSNQSIVNQLKKPVVPPQDDNKGSGASDLLPYALGPIAGGALAKGAAVLAGKMSPMLSALFLNPKNVDKLGRKEFTDFDILNEGAGKVGFVNTSYDPESKFLHIINTSSTKKSPYTIGSIPRSANSRSWSAGATNVQDVLNGLMKHYPEAKTIGGARVSGVREGPAANSETNKVIIRNLPGRE